MHPKASKAHVMHGDIACDRRLYAEGRRHYDQALAGGMKDVDKSEIAKKKARVPEEVTSTHCSFSKTRGEIVRSRHSRGGGNLYWVENTGLLDPRLRGGDD